MECELIHAGCYRSAQKDSQINRFVFLGFNVSGLVRSRVFSPNRTLLRDIQNTCGFLTLNPVGCLNHFEYNAERENYVIQCRIPSLQYRDGDLFAQLTDSDGEHKLNLFQAVPRGKILELREEFQRICGWFRGGTADGRWKALLHTQALFGEFLEEPPLRAETPEARLKEFLDADRHFADSIEAMSRRTGVSPLYARKLFERRYGMTPREYRARKRLSRILFLLNGSSLAPKEIALETGMRNVTHLYQFLKQRIGLTPGMIREKGSPLHIPPPSPPSI